MSPRSGSSQLSRRRGTRAQRARILVVTEGEVSEPEYLRGLSAYLRATGVRLSGPKVKGTGRDPIRVVETALNLYEQDKDYDHVWCVFDVDEHSRLTDAISSAHSAGFDCAISNPCFEVWLLWHFEDCRKAVTSDDLKRRLRRHGVVGKAIPSNFPYSDYTDAISRCGTPCSGEPPNPGSNVCRLAGLMSTAGKGLPS